MGIHTCIDKNGNLKVDMEKRLDAVLAPIYMDELNTFAGQDINKVLFFAANTDYISSAGIRVIVFAKQKLFKNAEICLVAPTEFVIETLTLTGIIDYLTILDSYEDDEVSV